MPELDGREAAERMRKFESARRCKPVQIVGLTGEDSEEITSACQQAGMNTILTKPIKKQDLNNILNSLLSSFGK